MKERSFLLKTLLDMNRAGVLVGLSPKNKIAPTSQPGQQAFLSHVLEAGSPRAGRRHEPFLVRGRPHGPSSVARGGREVWGGGESRTHPYDLV